MRLLFPGQQLDETIYLVIRKHWFYLMAKVAAWFLFVIILFLFNYLVPKYFPGTLLSPYSDYIALFKNVYVTFLILGLLIIWVLYYVNIQVITNERVVDVSQDSLFSHVVSELYLTKIEDVTGEIDGVLPTAFNFGNVYVQTAGTRERFEFTNVPQPQKVEKLILDLSEHLQRKHVGIKDEE